MVRGEGLKNAQAQILNAFPHVDLLQPFDKMVYYNGVSGDDCQQGPKTIRSRNYFFYTMPSDQSFYPRLLS